MITALLVLVVVALEFVMCAIIMTVFAALGVLILVWPILLPMSLGFKILAVLIWLSTLFVFCVNQ